MRLTIALLCAAVVAGRLVTGINGEGGSFANGQGDGMPIHWERLYIDFAHFVVFATIGAGLTFWWASNRLDSDIHVDEAPAKFWHTAKRLFLIAVLLTVFEVVVAVVSRKVVVFGSLLDRWNLMQALWG